MIRFVVRRDCRGKAGNEREHHMARWRRYQSERATTEGAALVQLGGQVRARLVLMEKPLVVTLTRLGKRLLDDDNLPAACAAVRDQLAVMLGVTDGPNDKRVSWKYDQLVGDYAVDVRIESAADRVGA